MQILTRKIASNIPLKKIHTHPTVMEHAEARQDDISAYMLEKPGTIHIVVGTAGSGKSHMVSKFVPLFVELHSVLEVFFLGYCYRHAKTLQQTVALGETVMNHNMSLHRFMGVEPHDVVDFPSSADDAFFFDLMCSKATYPNLQRGVRTLVVLEEVFFSPRLVASIIVFLAGRPDVSVVACGDPGQIARGPTSRSHASEVFWSRLTMDCVRPVDLHVLLQYSFRQSDSILRTISSEIERFNSLPINTLQHKARDVFAAVIPDSAIMEWMVARAGVRFWFVSSREFANSFHSQFISLTDPHCYRVLSAPGTTVYLSRDTAVYETAKSLTAKNDKRIPCSTPCTVVGVEDRSVILKVEGYDEAVSADFTCKDAASHPIRPVYFNTLDSIQGNTVRTDMLVHFDSRSRIPDAGLYVCFTRPVSTDIFYCTASFLSRIQADAAQTRPICHANARFLYTKAQ
jgi:hypothetical protein